METSSNALFTASVRESLRSHSQGAGDSRPASREMQLTRGWQAAPAREIDSSLLAFTPEDDATDSRAVATLLSAIRAYSAVH